MGASVAGFTTVVTSLMPVPPVDGMAPSAVRPWRSALAAATSASNSRKSPALLGMPLHANHETAGPGSSTASMTPSSLRAVTARPGPGWRWPGDDEQSTVVRSPSSRRTVLPSSVTDRDLSRRHPARGWWSVDSDHRSGSFWTRSPPGKTLSTCSPRQTASTGRSRARAASQQAELQLVATALVPPFPGSGLLTVPAGVDIAARR
jgi:hypothetical protein